MFQWRKGRRRLKPFNPFKVLKKKASGRQGRSKAIRAIKDAEDKERKRIIEVKIKNGHPVPSEKKCHNCEACYYQHVVEDIRTGDSICTACGAVQNTNGGVQGIHHEMPEKPIHKSKPYEREIHYQQRIAQATCIDPLLKKRVLVLIADYIWEHSDELGPPSIYGPKTFKRITNECKDQKTGDRLLPPRTPRHWIQIRQRLNTGDLRGTKRRKIDSTVYQANGIYQEDDDEDLYESEEDEETDEENEETILLEACHFDTEPWEVFFDARTARRLKIRYKFVSKAFDCVIRDHPDPWIRRKNIINLNYTIVQLLRLEDESLFRMYGRYFPQLTGSQQTTVNNARWKLIVDYCTFHFAGSHNPVTSEQFVFNWEFKPLEMRDIIWYCTYFR